jgi:parallel beta-helix repeat protein
MSISPVGGGAVSDLSRFNPSNEPALSPQKQPGGALEFGRAPGEQSMVNFASPSEQRAAGASAVNRLAGNGAVDDPTAQGQLLPQILASLISMLSQMMGQGASGSKPSSAVASPGAGPASTNPPGATNAAQTPQPAAGANGATAPASGGVQTPPSSALSGIAPTSAASGTQPPNSINAKDFGVKGDGVSDDQVGLQNAMDAAKAQGKSLWLPEGTYNHSGVLTADGVSIQGAGQSTELHATNPYEAAIKLTGSNPSLSNLKTTVNAQERSSQPDASAILVQSASNASVTNCTALGAAANGIRLDRASNSVISHNLVSGTNADGIALMNGSTDNRVTGNVVDQAADDAYSSDSYAGDPIQNRGNLFEGNLAQNSRYGRAFVSMGGADDIIRGNYVNSAPDHTPIIAGTDSNSGTMTGVGGIIEDNHVGGDAPAMAAILGWDPGSLGNASAYSAYQAGTGPGANNTPGNRS